MYRSLPVLSMLLALIMSCSQSAGSYVLEGMNELRDEQKELITLLNSGPHNREERFALMNRIATNLATENRKEALILFLTNEVELRPEDPYNAYWLLMVAHTYLEDNAPEMAGYYFKRILEKCPDLQLHGQSIHLVSLQNLIRITDSPGLLVRYYSDMITRFSDDVDLGYTYFMLARSYEKLGEWELAIQTYTQFLGYGRFGIVIPGIHDSYEYAKRLVDYNSSSKDWTFETLDELVQSIKKAINTYDHRSLERYRAKVSFFAMSWKQDSNDVNAEADFRMRDFMGGNRIRYDEELDASSNPNEAYLRTRGWNQYVSVWYLYFRKVNFPADPDIHGRWEWAGIYYGEKL
jgi:hypothetical protein